jgi:hypothetical protein
VVGDGAQGLAVNSFVDQDLDGAGDRLLGVGRQFDGPAAQIGGADADLALEPRSLVLRGWMSGRRRQANVRCWRPTDVELSTD